MYYSPQAPLSIIFRQEYWSGLPFSSPWVHSNPGIKPRSPNSLLSSHQKSSRDGSQYKSFQETASFTVIWLKSNGLETVWEWRV